MLRIKRLAALLLLSVFLFTTARAVASEGASVLDQLISISVQHEKLGDVLKKIEDQSGVRFIYESGIIDADSYITISVTKQAVGSVLKQLVLSAEIKLYVVGNKVIFYKSSNPPQGITGTVYTIPLEKAEKKPKQSSAPNVTTVTVYDSVIVECFDTIKIVTHDTLRHVEYDTISIKRTVKSFINEDLDFRMAAGLSCVMFNDKPAVRENGAAALYSEAEQNTESSFRGDLYFSAQYQRYMLEIGLSFNSLKWNADYDYSHIHTDSTSIIGYDNTYEWIETVRVEPPGPGGGHGKGDSIVIKDSTQVLLSSIPVYRTDTVAAAYSGMNRLQYLTVPLQLLYDVLQKKKWGAAVGAGINAHFLIKSEGYTILPDYKLVQLSDVYQSFYMSALFSLRCNYNLSEHHQLSAHSCIAFPLGDMHVAESSYQKKITAFSIGIMYAYRF